MYKIAVCDDEHSTCTEMEQLIEDAEINLKEQFRTECFMTGEELLDKIQNGEKYDFIFLDIELKSVNGVEIGRVIREELHDYKTLIIYISSHESYAMSLFQIHPFDFLIKPLKADEVFGVINKGIKSYRNSSTFLEYRIGKRFCNINCDNILYLYSNRKKIILILLDGEKEEFYGKIKEVILGLPDNFSIISQSYVINRNYVYKYGYDEVEMINKDKLPISRGCRKDIRETIQIQEKGLK